MTPGTRPLVALVAHDVNEAGGMERAMAELLKHGQRDYRFVVVSRTLAPQLRGLATWAPVTVPPRPAPLRFACFYVAAALKLRKLKPDLVHTCGAVVPNKASVATVHFCHAGYAEIRHHERGRPDRARQLNEALLRVLARAAERWSYRPARTAVLAAVSSGVAAELERHYPGNRVVVTPNGVDAARFAADEATRKEVREEQRVGDDVVLLFLAGNWPQKGLDLLIEALGEIRRRAGNPPLLWVVGRGDEDRYSRVARQAGVADRVIFQGPTTTPERWYAGADAFVLPSSYETFSLVCHEAAAAGLPVVATRVSGVTDLVEHGVSGLLVERDAGSLAAAISRLATDPELRRDLGERARARVADVTWQRSYDATAAAYEAAR